MLRSFFLLVVSLFAAPAYAQTSYLDPKELLEMMQASEVTYEIHEDPDAASKSLEILFPNPPAAYVRQPKFEQRNGRMVLTNYQLNEAADSLQQEGEKFFSMQDYTNASIYYSRALLADPTDYTNLLYLGDCKLQTGDNEGALADYQKAAEKNPLDYQPHMFSSTALTKLGRVSQARAELVKALTLFPNYPTMLAVANARAKDWGMEVHEHNYRPKAYAQEIEGGYKLGIASSHWMIYAVAKALWEGEPKLRQRLIKSEAKGWQMESERQALIALMMSYDMLRDSEGFVPDPDIERLQAIHKAGLFDAYILYEIASHLNQNVILQISPEGRALVERYVDEFVLPVKE